MKFNNKHNLICVLLICFIISAFAFTGRADFGSFSGDSDYSSGGWDSGSSWDSGSGWDSGSSWNSGYSSGGGYGYGYSGSSNSYDDEESVFDTIFSVIFVIVLIIIICTVILQFIGASNIHANKTYVDTTRNRTTKGNPISQYKEVDPDFDSAAFSEKLSNVYVQLQDAWHKKDLTPVRPYLTDGFYAQADRMLDALRRDHQTDYIERIAVLSVEPKTYYQENGSDHIIAFIKSRIVDYTLDDSTGNLISGDKNKEKFMTYEYDLCRKSGVTTKKDTGLKTVVCPHCGAPLDINHSAKCPYCDSVITIENEDWAIDNIKGVSQQTM